MKPLENIFIPQETVNDSEVEITDIYFENGAKVDKGVLLAEFETSKALFEIHSTFSGYINFYFKEGAIVKVGDKIASIFEEPYKEEILSKETKSDVIFSKKALMRMKQLKIKESIFSNYKTVKEQDVEKEYKNILKNQVDELNINEKVDVSYTIKKSENNIIIIGGGGHAKMCIDILMQIKDFNIVGIIDDQSNIGQSILDIPIIGTDKDIEKLFKEGVKNAVIGFGALNNPKSRSEKYLELKKIGYNIPNLIHPSAIIENSVSIGEGNQIMGGAIIGSGVNICDNCIINSGSIISHDSVLKNNVHITPGGTLAGSVYIGENTIIGMNASIFIGVKIGENVVISNGLNIISDILDNNVIKNT
tara:strand:- start:1445 stop:2530 length:1086 start_codon:yes stop_codon:yes gene_type:complete